jgi:short-subunit dehydrogenase
VTFKDLKKIVSLETTTVKAAVQQQQLQQSQSTTTAGSSDCDGTIINIGSANGFFGVPCASAYVATKFVLYCTCIFKALL